jgi:hypothetical protein
MNWARHSPYISIGRGIASLTFIHTFIDRTYRCVFNWVLQHPPKRRRKLLD